MVIACLAGGTGLVGGHILSTLAASPAVDKVNAFTRRTLPASSKLSPIESTETSSWAAAFPTDASIFFSSLGTTRARAGGVAAQRKVDYDLALELATAAKQAGVKTYVLISSGGSNAESSFAYIKMKGQLEDEVSKLGFDHCVILRPGLIVGSRDHLRAAEAGLQAVARFAGALSGSVLKDFWAQDASVIARAAVAAGLKSLQEGSTPKVWRVEQSEIVRLGRTEWKET